MGYMSRPKEKDTRNASVEDKAYMADVARLGCAICLRLGHEDTPSEVHHRRSMAGIARRAPHTQTIPLCPEHHRGQSGLHGMGRKAFEWHYGVTEVELVAETRERVNALRKMLV